MKGGSRWLSQTKLVHISPPPPSFSPSICVPGGRLDTLYPLDIILHPLSHTKTLIHENKGNVRTSSCHDKQSIEIDWLTVAQTAKHFQWRTEWKEKTLRLFPGCSQIFKPSLGKRSASVNSEIARSLNKFQTGCERLGRRWSDKYSYKDRYTQWQGMGDEERMKRANT